MLVQSSVQIKDEEVIKDVIEHSLLCRDLPQQFATDFRFDRLLQGVDVSFGRTVAEYLSNCRDQRFSLIWTERCLPVVGFLRCQDFVFLRSGGLSRQEKADGPQG